MLARLFKLMVLLLVLAVAGVAGSYVYIERWAIQPYDVGAEQIVELKPALPLSTLSRDLAKAGVVNGAMRFHAWVKLNGHYQEFKAGKYRFSGPTTPSDIAMAMIKGDTYNPIVLTIAVPEGFTLKMLAERLAANGVGHIVEIQHLFTDRGFLDQLKVPAKSLEGFIYPATYNFHEMPTAAQALELMVKTFWQNLPKDYEKAVAAKGLTLSDAVTFASLIEMETRQDDEKPLISEVIWRRLKDKVPLAIDAALIYGIPDYDGTLHWSNLSDKSNPYNTRVHVGLPPSPIGSPSTKSLEAVLTPSNFGYYYYVLIPGQARHHFSKTLAEHNLNVKKLVNATKREKGKDKD